MPLFPPGANKNPWMSYSSRHRSQKRPHSLEINGARCKAISVTRAWTKNSWDHNQSQREKADFQLCGAPPWGILAPAYGCCKGAVGKLISTRGANGNHRSLSNIGRQRTLMKNFHPHESNLCTPRSICRKYMGVFPSCYLWWAPRLEVWNGKVKQEERSSCKLIMGHWAEGQTQSCRQNHLECFHLFVWKLMIFLTFWHTSSSLEMNWGNFHSLGYVPLGTCLVNKCKSGSAKKSIELLELAVSLSVH